MADTVREVMSAEPLTLQSTDSLREAARKMREADIGPVIVEEGGEICGVLTDRDIVVRAIAEGLNPDEASAGEICSRDLATLEPDQPVEDAIRLMRERAIRRLPVVEEGKPVGIVSIGDLALERDRRSALADISAAQPNR